ncbi:hypothetical protein HMPREF9163_01445 [Selenomonas sp. oral taxon 138 str. F0429]|nr:hypothetical protein HMPREF9163_01445 [Selenomonas sp. oral taxon 138 str. F0429]
MSAPIIEERKCADKTSDESGFLDFPCCAVYDVFKGLHCRKL